MFAPVGFVPFEKVGLLCEDAAMEYMRARRPTNPSEVEEAENDAGLSVLTIWLYGRTLLELDVFVCSIDGRIFRIAPSLLNNESPMTEQRFDWPLREGTILWFIMRQMVEKSPEVAEWVRFPFLNLRSYTVAASSDSLARIREEAAEAGEDAEVQCRIASLLDGWALCVRETDAPTSVNGLWEMLGFDLAADSSLPAGRRAKGRPEMQTLARDTYLRIFPSGHKGVSWKEVERRVSHEAGRPISEKTIRRAIGHNLGHNGQNPPPESS